METAPSACIASRICLIRSIRVPIIRHNKIVVLSSLPYWADLFCIIDKRNILHNDDRALLRYLYTAPAFFIHPSVQPEVHERVNRHRTGTNSHKSLSALEKTLTGCGGGLSVAALPTPTGHPTTIGTAPPHPCRYRSTDAPVSGVGGLGALSRTCPVGVGSLDFVTHADKRRGQNRASDNPPRTRHNEHCSSATD